MSTIDLLYVMATLAALGFIVHGVTDMFSREARIGRKRRKNYGRISHKTGRPVVLNVRTRKV